MTISYIKFDVAENRYSTGGYDPKDSWSRDSTDANPQVSSAQRVGEDNHDVLGIEADIQIGQVVYLVWAQYSTGDSFGNDGGQYELLEVCLTREAAEDRKEHYEGVTDFSVPWSGYFEHLDFVKVQGLVVM
jgi:hypothetical protein